MHNKPISQALLQCFIRKINDQFQLLLKTTIDNHNIITEMLNITKQLNIRLLKLLETFKNE